MSNVIKNLLAQFDKDSQEYDNLVASGTLTADEKKRLDEIPNRLSELQKEITAAKEADDKVAAAKNFRNGQASIAPVSNRTQALMVEQGEIKDILEKALASRMTWEGRAGQEHFQKTAMGHLVASESEGWSVPDEKWKKVCEPAYLKSFDKMMRSGIEKVDAADFKTLSEGSDIGGGYLVPPEYIARLIARKPYPTRVLEFVDVMPCSSDQVVIPRLNYDNDTADIYSSAEPRIQWIGEKGPTPSQPDMAFGDVTVPVYTGQFYVEVSRNLTEDSIIPINGIVQKFSSQAYELGMDQVVTVGDGNAKPTGIVTNAGGTGLYIPTQNIGNPPTANGLTQLVYGLPPQYSDTPGTVALMNRTSAFASFAQITDASGQYIFGLARSNGPEGMAVARKPELFGYPVIFSAFMANIGAGNIPVAFGDLKETYTLCQRVGLTVEAYGQQDKSMLLANKVGWLFRFRAGGMVTQNRATHAGQQS